MKAFFDTNILIYAQEQGAKADKARALLAAGGVLSVQVLNEFAAVARRQHAKNWPEIGEAIDDAMTLSIRPSIGRSAGARLTVIRFAGSERPEATKADRTRSRDSATALSPRPTTLKTTLPLDN